MDTIIVLIIIIIFLLVVDKFRVEDIISTMQRQLQSQHEQIQALKARLKRLEQPQPKDEVDKFIDKIQEM